MFDYLRGPLLLSSRFKFLKILHTSPPLLRGQHAGTDTFKGVVSWRDGNTLHNLEVKSQVHNLRASVTHRRGECEGCRCSSPTEVSDDLRQVLVAVGVQCPPHHTPALGSPRCHVGRDKGAGRGKMGCDGSKPDRRMAALFREVLPDITHTSDILQCLP
ncbi:hypothetical protein E2C01_018277 [Portunus trituberculatus]|uniref:Uncharacterized protein n=1 Tax=Portunus trituberculatus TaxID=210409 RepID=A0A5B7DWD8_PORTR|nr:hypothetical protein [Portunus trituberculatus]